jgi:hypothetical protein
METRRLSCAETAKLIRPILAKNFPGIKFSVRSSTYSMGASIDVSWDMGPATREVDKVIGGFEGSSFDGMNDLKSYQDCWLLPDGSAQLAYRPDSNGGSIPEYVSDAPHPNAELVSFGADSVHTNRNCPNEIEEQLAKDMCALQKVWYHGEATTGLYGENDREWVTTLAWRLFSKTSFKPGEGYGGVRYATEEEGKSEGYDQAMRIIKTGVKEKVPVTAESTHV